MKAARRKKLLLEVWAMLNRTRPDAGMPEWPELMPDFVGPPQPVSEAFAVGYVKTVLEQII